MYKVSSISLICLSLLSACGADNESAKTQIPNLNALQPAMSELTPVSETTFAQHVKNGIFVRHRHTFTIPDGAVISPPVITTPEFSQTNNQEQNVSEADRIQFDGNYLFIAANHYQDQNNDTGKSNAYVRILKSDNEGLLNEVATIEASDDDQIKSMYLENNALVTIGNESWFDIQPFLFASTSNSFTLSFYDVALPEQPNTLASLSIDGSLVDSRVVDGNLYVISNYFPVVDSWLPDATDDAILANYKLVQSKNINDLMPKITLRGSSQRENLVNPDACLVPANSTNADGYDGITTITKINIANPSLRQSLCINTQIDGLYASQNALYAYTTDWSTKQQTAFHKFSLGDSFSYQATGIINGRLASTMANLRLSEYENYLRVIATEDLGGQIYKHSLHVLSQQGSKLNNVGQYPNNETQTPIGKTNNQGQVFEDIYAARFFKNRAYIVTFERTDPLYTLDLSTPIEPKLLGALEIPGYSSYLHPIGESHLLGIGQEVENIAIGDGRTIPVAIGSKVALFDITNLNAPTLLASQTFEKAYSPVEFDYHAFTSLVKQDGTTRIAIPLETWIENNSGSGSFWQNRSELALFEINPTADVPMNLIGTSEANNLSDPLLMYISGYSDRSVINGDAVYYVHGNYVWQSDWLTPSNNIGPR